MLWGRRAWAPGLTEKEVSGVRRVGGQDSVHSSRSPGAPQVRAYDQGLEKKKISKDFWAELGATQKTLLCTPQPAKPRVSSNQPQGPKDCKSPPDASYLLQHLAYPRERRI